MKRSKSTEAAAAASKNPRKWKKLTRLFFAFGAFYLLFIAFKFRHFLQISAVQSGGGDGYSDDDRPLFSSVYHETLDRKPNPDPTRDPPLKPVKDPIEVLPRISYGRLTGEIMKRRQGYRYGWAGNLTMLETMASDAWILGSKAWEELKNYEHDGNLSSVHLTGGKKMDSCPSSVSMKGEKSVKIGSETEEIMLLPCGLEMGSSVTIIGVPEKAHREYVPELGRKWKGDELVMVSQFMVELQGLKAVDGEDPPKILHFNPRLKGDWSKMPVIELNTCYRMQWGKSMRCSGLLSDDDEDKVDGYNKCEKWVRSDNADAKESKSASWLNRFIGRAKKPEITWPFPFVEGKLFVLTIRSGVEGYHIYVGGLHITSFPYRPGFTLEDATGLSIKGNVGIHSVYATSLPKSHPSSSVQKVLEMSGRWRSRPLPEGPIHLFIGILSATNHFAERMAIRKSWMQYPDFKTSYVVARFFVALGPRKEVNSMLKKEAEYFRDVVILPFMDHYELVVLKTIAICEYGIRNVSAAYVMKCDDDTFVRLDVVLKEIKKVANKRSLYMGNLNLFHRPLRTGKWAVTYEEWPENIYPPYANGPGYIISSNIASFIASKHANGSLRIFKMEDVSMGMWVEEFNSTNRVQYSHNWKFCQFGCIENYFTAHYQSPKQMTCLWDKLSRGQAHCCNFR